MKKYLTKNNIIIMVLVYVLVILLMAVDVHNRNVNRELYNEIITARNEKAVGIDKHTNMIRIGNTIQLKLKNTTGKYTWSSSNPKVATVDENGLVTGIDEGEATISVVLNSRKLSTTFYIIGNKVTPTKEKEVYLTFDDGPSENTGKILEILKEYNVRATFFVTAHSPKYKHYMKQAYEQGNAIAAHSYTHKYSIYRSEYDYFKDLNKIEKYIESATGTKTDLIRFPGGSSNVISKKYNKGIMTKVAKMVEKKGYRYVDWNVDSTDASGNNVKAEKIVKNATSTKEKHACILMHDSSTKKTTVEALPSIIKEYKKRGYTFKTLDQTNLKFHHAKINN